MPTFDSQTKQKAALFIVRELQRNGFEALFAGGIVRDMVMEIKEIGDIDIATNATPESIAKLFPHTIKVGEQFGVMVVVQKGIPFEVATFRSDIGIADGRHPAGVVYTDAKNDALRRDFTINGLFLDPTTQNIIDYVSGIDDIHRKVVRAIGEPELRFKEDYLRMLRAIRFAARFSFQIESETWNAIKRHSGLIVQISPERIFAELDKILRQPNPDIALELLKDSGLLKHILPEVNDLVGVEQPVEFHPEGDVFTHTKIALKLMQPNPSSILAWSVLLHDIGKPSTMTISDRIRFNNHDRVGAVMSRELLKRLHASNALIKGVEACIENHMNFKNVRSMRLSTLKKFLSRDTILQELELHRVDCLASHGIVDNYDFLLERYSSIAAETLKPSPIIKGNDLLELGLKPGPMFGEILSEVYDLQLEEKIHKREDALAVVRSIIARKKAPL